MPSLYKSLTSGGPSSQDASAAAPSPRRPQQGEGQGMKRALQKMMTFDLTERAKMEAADAKKQGGM